MKRIFRLLEDLLWPHGFQCLCCDELSHGHFLCADCQHLLKAAQVKDDGNNPFVRSAYSYTGVARKLVLLLKEECCARAAEVLAERMAEIVQEMNLPPETVLTWVTMPRRRYHRRGIDHGQTLCRAVAARTGHPVRQLLIRKGNRHTQRGLSRKARLKNLTGSLICPNALAVPVLLIDDVMTTGATASVCTSALKNSGAPQVFVLTATCVLPH